MVFKLGMEAQKHWRRLNNLKLVAKVVIDVKFIFLITICQTAFDSILRV